MAVVSRSEWKRLSRDYRSGDPRKGTAKALMQCGGFGTCLVPVTVVADDLIDRLCRDCGADVLGNDPHAADCSQEAVR